MHQLILCRGIQGSGKSTWAKEWAHEKPEERVRFNNDDIRRMLGDYWVPSREPMVLAMKKAFMEKAMERNYDIVIDNMNLNPKEEAWYQNIIDKHNVGKEKLDAGFYQLVYKDFFIPVEECIRRDALRPNPIGEKVIKMTWNRYKDYINLQVNKELERSMCKSNPTNKPNAIVVDIDGCIALNLTGRPYYGEGSAEGMTKDTPVHPIIHLVEDYRGTVIFLTGRTGTPDVQKATEEWIQKYMVKGKNSKRIIKYRPAGSYVKSYIYKSEVLTNEILPNYNVELVIEDSTDIVKVLRKMDLLVLQPNSIADNG